MSGTPAHLYLVGERAGGEAAGDRGGAGVGGELEDGALAVGARRDHAHVRRVLDGGDGTRRQQQLLPRLTHVDDVHSCE